MASIEGTRFAAEPSSSPRRLLGAAGAALAVSGLVAASLGAASCGGGSDETGDGGEGGAVEAACALGDRELEDGRCQPPGLPLDMPCPPGETPMEDGGCEAAGVAPSRCGDGFVGDGERGCRPILPEEPCPDGLMAVPGETTCRAVAPCGTGTWGNIPIEADTHFVDGSYSGVESDGSQEKPWKTIQEGFDAAAEGALVAIAAGEYKEKIVLDDHRARLWGRCPSMVSIDGLSDPGSASIRVSAGGTELHDLAVTGSGGGVVVQGADDVLLERVWIHDTGWYGILSQDADTGVRGSLVERTREIGIVQSGATLTIEGSAVRDSLPVAGGQTGVAVEGLSGALTLRSSLIERATGVGVLMQLSEVLLEGVAVRDMLPGQRPPGFGFSAEGGDVTIRGSTFERFHDAGIAVFSSELTVEHVTIVDGRLTVPDPAWGTGLVVGISSGAVPSNAVVRWSTIDDQPGVGLYVYGSLGLVESTLIKDCLQEHVPEDYLLFAAWADESPQTVFRYSMLRDNHVGGMAFTDSAGLFEASVVRDMQPQPDAGICFAAELRGDRPPEDVIIRSSLLDRCIAAGAYSFDARLVVETSIIRDVNEYATKLWGDGVAVWNKQRQDAAVELLGVRIEDVDRAGVFSYGARADIGFSSLSCTGFELVGEMNGQRSFSYNKLGDNACGCPEVTELCRVQSPGLSPPPLP